MRGGERGEYKGGVERVCVKMVVCVKMIGIL